MGPVVVIVGETASGKSALAVQLAQRFNGEIICADSRTVYKAMDIGTAKPSAAERRAVPHHLLDVVEPDQPYNAAMFKSAANELVAAISARGRLPIIVGGTGLYIDAWLHGYSFTGRPDHMLRSQISAMTVEEIRAEILKQGLTLPQNAANPRHLQRVLEAGHDVSPQKSPERPNTLVLGVRLPREVLKARIEKRVEQMIAQGLIEEARQLFKTYGREPEACKTPGYRALFAYIEGEISLEEASHQFVASDLKLAKRQRTWFKRNKSTHWITDPSDAVALVTTFLSK